MSWLSGVIWGGDSEPGFGVIACGAMTPDLLDTEIAETKKRTQRPFGVNLITMHPMLPELIDTCTKHHVTHVVLAGGLPPTGSIDRIKSGDAKLVCFAPALSLAKKLMRSGADALVIEGMEAGGHIGPVATLFWRRKSCPTSPMPPVFVAGGSSRRASPLPRDGRGRGPLGTASSARRKVIAHPNFKKVFIAPRPATPFRACRATRACR